jgi:hypothetical protein
MFVAYHKSFIVSCFRNLTLLCALMPLVGCPGVMLFPVRRTTYHVPSSADASAQDIRALSDSTEVTSLLGPPSASSTDGRSYLYRLSATVEWDDVASTRDQRGLAVRTSEVLILFKLDTNQKIVQRMTYECEDSADAMCALTPQDAMLALEAELPVLRSSGEQPRNGQRR